MFVGFVALSAEIVSALGFENVAVFLRCVASGIVTYRIWKRGLFWQDAVSLGGTLIGTLAPVSTSLVSLKWILVSLGAILGAALPPEHARLMRSRGKLAVGTRDGIWSKGRRNQHFRVWFPCTPPGSGGASKATPYFSADVPHAIGVAKFSQMPTWMFRHLALTDTGTFADAAPLAPVVKLPLLLFSHGLGGVRSTYSTMCADFASFGYTVVAFEHQDETASVTVDSKGSVLWYKRPTPEQVADNDNFVMRHRQLMHRREEIADFLADVRGGAADVDEAVRVVRQTADVSRVHLAGHSFGGATTIDCVAALRSHGILSGCALDSWMHPLGERERNAALSVPTIMLNTDLFQWRENVALMQTLAENAAAPSVVGFVPSTGHQSVSDFPQFLRIGTRLLKHTGPIDPEVALAAFSDAALAVFAFAERRAAAATNADDDDHFAALLGADVKIQFQSKHHE
jgi:platelet-activating factor acetylhydrolase